MDLHSVGLPKWPLLVVQGMPVTRLQAMEILVRTDSWRVFSNDRQWQDKVEEIAGIKSDNELYSIQDPQERLKKAHEQWAQNDAARDAMGVLDLTYLRNQRIASAYIGGPHGWCNWDGRIGCNSYNVGKWPSVSEIFSEWELIAKTFPYLSLWSQLYSGEGCEEDIVPVIEFIVEGGTVRAQSPTERSVDIERSLDLTPFLESLASGSRGERGCSEEQLRTAVSYVKSKLSAG